MRVSFCGHRDIAEYTEVQKWLYDKVENLIAEGATEFLLGGYGSFDNMSARVVREIKKKHPEILSVFVTPYINKEYDKELYDICEFPPLETVPKKYAILYRNRWMVDRADVVLAYVNNGFGGAAKTLDYAERRNKRILNFYDKNSD